MRRLPNFSPISRWLVPSRAFHQSRLAVNKSPISPYRLPQRQLRPCSAFIRRNANINTSTDTPSSRTLRSSSQTSALSTLNPDVSAPPAPPGYELYFTCKPCKHRSGPHRISKQGYHHGSTLITCPSCKSRHVISDHLRIFMDKGGTLEEIMARHGEKLKKGQLGIRPGEMVGNECEQEIEFWEDGTETAHGAGGVGQSKGKEA